MKSKIKTSTLFLIYALIYLTVFALDYKFDNDEFTVMWAVATLILSGLSIFFRITES